MVWVQLASASATAGWSVIRYTNQVVVITGTNASLECPATTYGDDATTESAVQRRAYTFY